MNLITDKDSTLLRVPKILTDKKVLSGRTVRKLKMAQKIHQLQEHKHQNVYHTNSFQGVPLNLFRNSGSRYSGHIEARSFSKMKSATLKITLNSPDPATDAGVLAAVPYWFERIEIRSQNGSKHVTTIYGDQMIFNLNLLDKNQLSSVLKNANMDSDWNSTKEFVGQRTKSYFLPLVGTWFDSDVYTQNLDGDIIVDFFPAGNIVKEANADLQIDCSAMSLIIQTENLTSEDEKSHNHFHSHVIQADRQLDWIPVREFSKTLTSGSQTTVDLDSVVGKLAGLVCYVRQTGASNDDGQNFKYVDLGDDAKIDLVTSGNRSVLGSGVPLDGSYLKNELWKQHFTTDFNVKNAIYLPFTEDTKRAYKGVVDGFIKMDGSGMKLVITPGSQGIDSVQVFVKNGGAVPTAGYFRVVFKGERSDVLDYDSTTASIKVAVEKMGTVKNYPGGPLTVTVDSTFDVGTGVVKFSCLKREVCDKFEIESSMFENPADASSQKQYTTHMTKRAHPDAVLGEDGFSSGVYDLECYALVYQNHYTRMGRVTTELH
jgi:hypothetical protein